MNDQDMKRSINQLGRVQAEHMDDVPKLPLLGGRTVAKETEACFTQAKYFRISIFTH